MATSGFQVEGAYNGLGQPANNWWSWEKGGRVEPSAGAVQFWEDPDRLLDRAARIGCDSFRLSIEWARCEPTEGRIDHAAVERYSDILDACRVRGLEPLVTLNHFTHPAWLGEDYWLQVDSPERFRAWVDLAVSALADRCSNWVTINELNILATNSYLTGVFPPGRRGDVAAALRALDNMLSAHVLAYEAIHRIQPGATVTTNNSTSSIYELDRLLIDLLVSRAEGVGRPELRPWLVGRRAEFYAAVGRGRPGTLERVLRRLMASVVPMEAALPRAVDAVRSSAHERCLDVVAVDYYDPVASHHLRVPGHRTSGGRSWSPSRELWDDRPDPSGLATYCAANSDGKVGLWVAENGLCNRVRRGRSYPRGDGWDRIRYLRQNLAAVADAVASGVPISGYWHWTIVDNYEWGSYEPRFGLFGVDRDAGVRISDMDSIGDDAAGEYARLISTTRARRYGAAPGASQPT